MKRFIDNERADSMIILVIATALLFFGLFYIIISYTFNPTIEQLTGFIDAGTVTEDTATAFERAVNMVKMSPFFLIVGLVLYCYERGKGTDISAQTFFGYMFLMIIGLVISVYLVFGFGLSVDGITQGLDGTMLTDVSEEWDTTGPRGTLITMLYYFCLLPGYLTSLLYMIHPIIKQKETSFEFSGGSGKEEYGDIELGQV